MSDLGRPLWASTGFKRINSHYLLAQAGTVPDCTNGRIAVGTRIDWPCRVTAIMTIGRVKVGRLFQRETFTTRICTEFIKKLDEKSEKSSDCYSKPIV